MNATTLNIKEEALRCLGVVLGQEVQGILSAVTNPDFSEENKLEEYKQHSAFC